MGFRQALPYIIPSNQFQAQVCKLVKNVEGILWDWRRSLNPVSVGNPPLTPFKPICKFDADVFQGGYSQQSGLKKQTMQLRNKRSTLVSSTI